jgi:hypothetical protein
MEEEKGASLQSGLKEQFVLCGLLKWRELSQLHSTCVLWRRWIGALPVSATAPLLWLPLHRVAELERCG